MATPNNMPRISASEREWQATRRRWIREYELDVRAESMPKVTESKEYKLARAGMILRRR